VFSGWWWWGGGREEKPRRDAPFLEKSLHAECEMAPGPQALRLNAGTGFAKPAAA